MFSESQNNVSRKRGYKLYFLLCSWYIRGNCEKCSQWKMRPYIRTHVHAKAWSKYHDQFKLFQLRHTDQSINVGDIFSWATCNVAEIGDGLWSVAMKNCTGVAGNQHVTILEPSVNDTLFQILLRLYANINITIILNDRGYGEDEAISMGLNPCLESNSCSSSKDNAFYRTWRFITMLTTVFHFD